MSLAGQPSRSAIASRCARGWAPLLALALATACRVGPAGAPAESGVRPRPDEPPVLESAASSAWPAAEGADRDGAYGALDRALEAGDDPAEVARAAQAVLAAEPDPIRQARAGLALAELAYDDGRDLDAIALAGRAREQLLAGGSAEQRALAERVLALAQARGGDPAEALAGLARLAAEPSVDTVALRAARAFALDRAGRRAEAWVAYAQWRAVLPDAGPAAAYAERRIRQLARALPGPERAAVGRLRLDAPTAACLDASARAATSGAAGPPSTGPCGTAPARLGLLLPRSGRFSALADDQLAVVIAARRVGLLGPAELEIEDPGDDPAVARQAAARLLRAGAERLVGPPSAEQVQAVEGLGVATIVPFDVLAGRGVGPSLEERVGALLAALAQGGARAAVVFAPSSSYGSRGVRAAEAAARDLGIDLVIERYPVETTSFSSVVSRRRAALERGAVAMIVDAMPRTEALARQLARDGLHAPLVRRRGLGASAEGLSLEAVAQARGALDGYLLAPSAWIDDELAPLAAEYRRLQGRGITAEGLLLARALAIAAGGPGDRRPRLWRVQDGDLVLDGAP